jgi:uncharacterized protein
MFAYRTPGVYFEWLDRIRNITRLRTDVVGFVGIAVRGPLHRPVKLESWQQYLSIFGEIGDQPQGFLGFSVRGFFENGGLECYVVRVVDPDQAAPATFAVCQGVPGEGYSRPLWGLLASSAGVWGQRLRVRLRRVGGNRAHLTVRLPQGNAEISKTWLNLPLDDLDELRRRIETGELEVAHVVNDRASRREVEDKRRWVRLVEFDPAPYTPSTADLRQGIGGCLLTSGTHEVAGRFVGGSDGLSSLRPAHLSGEGQPENVTWGLSALERIDEVSVVAMPDIMPMARMPAPDKRPDPHCDLNPTTEPLMLDPLERVEYPPAFDGDQMAQLQWSLIQHCTTLRDRFAILDCRQNDRLPESVIAWRRLYDSSYAALYYPWIKVPHPLGGLVEIPPSGHVAGIYARGDVEIGVHKPPANAPMEDVKDVGVITDDVVHGLLNERQINVLRAYAGRGIRIAGAVTLSSDSLLRYVNVRRLLLMIAESLDESTQWAVFEPNNRDLWRSIEQVVRGFLDSLWRAGMLDGATAEDAYRVRCDETTNPPEDTSRGMIQCEVGVQPPYPAEFVIVRIGKTEGGTEIRESRA